MNKKAQQVEIQMPGGQWTLKSTDKPRDVGLPIYPGAILVESRGSIEFTTPQDDRIGVIAVRSHTSDSVEKVDAWYRSHLGTDFRREAPGQRKGQISVQRVTVGSEDIAYRAEKEGLVRVVAIKRRGTGVEIALARLGKQEAQ